jgi:NAD(P)-dependent dehydrogenase (short-subunit alcohol dehydrogenase family)
MGEAISRDLISRGWIVAMTDIKESKGLVEELGSKARFYTGDVSNYSSQAKVFDQVFKEFGRIDALCANAGIVDRQSMYNLDVKETDEIPPEPNLACTDVDWKGV